MKVNMSRGPWIQTYSGKAFHLLSPAPEEVDIRDVAHALANKCRFTGHTSRFYSVAQHCVLGSRLLEGPLKLAFLLHELGEVYLPDVSAPLKPHVRWALPGVVDDHGGPVWLAWKTLEALHCRAACEALGQLGTLPLLEHPAVRRMDLAMLVAERDQLLGQALPGWGDYGLAAPIDIVPWTPNVAESAWLGAFEVEGRR